MKSNPYLIALVFFFFFTLSLTAQKRYYRHYEGESVVSRRDSILGITAKNGFDIPVIKSTMDLQFSADSVTGFVSIPKNETRYIVYSISGKLKNDTLHLFGTDSSLEDSQWLGSNSVYSSDIKFTGKSAELGQITGTFFCSSCENIYFNRNMAFVYNEIYSPNSIALNHFYAVGDTVIDGDGAEYHLSYDILLPNKYSPISACDTLTNNLLKMLFPDGSIKRIGDQTLDSLVRKDKIEYYTSTKRMLADTSEVYLNVESYNSNNLSIKLNEQGFLSTYYENTFYDMGAHGLSRAECNVFDIATGEALCLDDFIANKKMLGQLIARKTRNDYNIPETASLTEIGLDFDGMEIEPTENFYITKEGIGFVYNEYEIACYARGRLEFIIPFIDLVNYNLIKKTSKIMRVAKF